MDPISIALGLAQFAPTIMKFFGVGDKPVAVAEKVVQIAQTITGAKTPEEAMEVMKANAQMAQQFNLAVLQADTELEKAYLSDKASARDRDVAIVKFKGNNIRGDVLAYMAIGALVVTILLLMFMQNIPPASEKLLYVVLGALITIVKDVYSFEFGSSKSGEKNAQALTDIAKAP